MRKMHIRGTHLAHTLVAASQRSTLVHKLAGRAWQMAHPWRVKGASSIAKQGIETRTLEKASAEVEAGGNGVNSLARQRCRPSGQPRLHFRVFTKEPPDIPVTH